MQRFRSIATRERSGAMRVAAKVVGITIMNDDLCGVPSVSLAEHQVSSATHRASRPISFIIAFFRRGESEHLDNFSEQSNRRCIVEVVLGARRLGVESSVECFES